MVDGQVHVDAGLEEVGPVFFRLDIWDSVGAVMMYDEYFGLSAKSRI